MINYVIKDMFGGVPDGDQYVLHDTPESEREWRAFLSAFAKEFSECTVTEEFSFADWHYNTRALFAYLRSEKFYDEKFLSRVQGVLRKQRNPSFAQFECTEGKLREDKLRFLGSFMVFNDNVIFNRLSKESGLIGKLIPKQK
jgi:hypothetical protein